MMHFTLAEGLVSVFLQAAAPLGGVGAAASPATPTTPAPPPGPVGGGDGFAPVPKAPSTDALLASAQPKNRPVLELAAAERSAVFYQPNIRAAQQQTAAAVGRVGESRAAYLPQVTGIASWTYGNLSTKGTVSSGTTTTGSSTSGTTSTTSSSTSTASGYSSTTGSEFVGELSGSQLITDFGQTTNKWKAAERSVDSAKANEATTKNQILFNVRQAFFNARADRALIRVQMETLINEQKHLVQTEGFVQAGTQPEISLAQTKTDLANAKVALIQAENNYDIARAQLNMAMGVTASVDYDVADEGLGPVDGEDGPMENLVKQALAARPELANLGMQHEADVLTVRALKAGYAPTLSGIAAAGVFGSDLNNLEPAWEIGLSLSWPLLLGGLTQGQIHEAEGNLGAVDAQLEAERLQVRLDVEQAALSVRSAKVSIGATEEALINAKDQLRLADASYSQGVGSIIQLGDAQVAETSAGAQRVQADFNLAIARAQLLLALGRP